MLLAHISESILTTSARFPLLTTLTASIGAAVAVAFAFDLVKLVAELTFLRGTSLKKYGAGTGGWAVITGPTGDIGREFAHQLAAAGLNVVLVGRAPAKLAAFGAELREKYKVETRDVVVDFGKPDARAFDELRRVAAELKATVLVNSAGLSHDIPVYFAETAEDELLSIIDVNVKSTVLATQAVLPAMLAQKHGLVLTLGSFSALVPSAMLATYSGSKAFLERWSQALGEEVEELGVDVRVVLPYFVVSSMAKIRKPSLLIPTPSALVSSTLSSLLLARGASTRPFTSTPYWSHALFDFFMGKLGLGGRFAMGKGLAMHKDIRRRALKKRERLAKEQ